MAKKRVEEVPVMENITIDDTIEQEMPRRIIPNRYQSESTENFQYSQKNVEKKEPINCLRNERVIVKFVPNKTAMVTDPHHILSFGMAENATRSYVVPKYSSTGLYKNVLTNNEKDFLEQIMGLEPNTLSIYKKVDNFWDDSNPNGVGRVTLRKQDNYLDLSVPIDYIKYKILLANSDYIAPSLEELEERPKASYQFVIISENAETESNLNKLDTIQRCYMEYGKIENDFDTLRVLIELLEGRATAPTIKIDYLKGKVNEWIQRKPKQFLKSVQDEYLPAKVLIRKCVEAGLIAKKNDTYYLREDGSPLCELGEESVLDVAARYISSIKHQDLKYSLEAKLKQ